jgi:hypothetical protein
LPIYVSKADKNVPERGGTGGEGQIGFYRNILKNPARMPGKPRKGEITCQ